MKVWTSIFFLCFLAVPVFSDEKDDEYYMLPYRVSPSFLDAANQVEKNIPRKTLPEIMEQIGIDLSDERSKLIHLRMSFSGFWFQHNKESHKKLQDYLSKHKISWTNKLQPVASAGGEIISDGEPSAKKP